MSKFDLESGEYHFLLLLIEESGGFAQVPLDEDDKKRLLPLAIKLLLSRGFELSQVVSVWNDVLEGKE